jgi:hypothetical protein
VVVVVVVVVVEMVDVGADEVVAVVVDIGAKGGTMVVGAVDTC